MGHLSRTVSRKNVQHNEEACTVLPGQDSATAASSGKTNRSIPKNLGKLTGCHETEATALAVLLISLCRTHLERGDGKALQQLR